MWSGETAALRNLHDLLSCLLERGSNLLVAAVYSPTHRRRKGSKIADVTGRDYIPYGIVITLNTRVYACAKLLFVC